MRRVLFWHLMGMVLFLWGSVATAQVPDSIRSFHIDDADGATDPDTGEYIQSTDIGAGIKTPHIQNHAITSSKIAPGAVDTGQLAEGAVDTDQLAKGAVDTDQLAKGAVDIDQLAKGAVDTDQLAEGAVGPGQLTSGAVQPWHIGMYGKVAFVAPEGGDYTDPAVAMNNFETWCGTPSESNPCIIKIMPGVYDIGGSYVYMRSYIDIEGSGIETTKVVGNGSVVVYAGGVDHAELRSLSIENNRTDGTANGVSLVSSSLRLTDLDIKVSNAGSSRGISATESSPVIQRVNVVVAGSSLAYGISVMGSSGRWTDFSVSSTASGGSSAFSRAAYLYDSQLAISRSFFESTSTGSARGLRIREGSSMTLENATVYATGVGSSLGVLTSDSSSAKIFGSHIIAGSYAIHSEGTTEVDSSVLDGITYSDSGGAVRVGNSKMIGGADGTGTLTCAGINSDNYTFFANVCP